MVLPSSYSPLGVTCYTLHFRFRNTVGIFPPHPLSESVAETNLSFKTRRVNPSQQIEQKLIDLLSDDEVSFETGKENNHFWFLENERHTSVLCLAR